MSIFEYNEEEEMRKLREAEREIWQRRGRIEGQAKGIAEGRVEGRAEGRVEGKAESVLEVLELYEQVPEYVKKRISEEKDFEILSAWLKEAVRAGSIETFLEKTGLKVPENQ